MQRDPDRLSQHVQAILDTVLRSGMVYGPLKSFWDPERRVLIARGNWCKGVREPYWRLRKKWGNDPTSYPPAAACSTLVGLVLGAYLDKGPEYDPRWGRSITRALRDDPALSADALWLAKGKRDFAWRQVANGFPMPAPLSVAIYRNHVSLVLDADELSLRNPRTGQSLSGRWVLSADGGFRDLVRYRLGRRLVRRLFCGRPITFEPVSTRARRDERPFALVGIRTPHSVPERCPLVVEGPMARTAPAAAAMD